MKYYIKVYGCQMNKYDGSVIETILDRSGHMKVAKPDIADIIIINTCSVREHAERRAQGYIQVLSNLKKKSGKRIAVCGCMAQRLKENLLSIIDIDYVVGPDNYLLLPDIIKTNPPQVSTTLDGEIYTSTKPNHTGISEMITVMRGCDNFCSYCIVPYVRGPARSKPTGAIIDEIIKAVEKGTKEILLLGQDITSFNDNGTSFPNLLEKVSEIDNLRRIRFLTSHPKGIDDKLINKMKVHKKICPHLHLPLQSGSNRILKSMNRGYSIEYYIDLLGKIRKAIPDISLTTDLIVGFPTETEHEYYDTIRAVEKIRFDFAYMFRYSERPKTQAAKLNPKIPEEEIKERLKNLITIQNKITKEKNMALIGKEFDVLVEHKGKRGNFLGKIPQNLMIAIDDKVKIGNFYRVKIKRTSGWTPIGEVLK